MPLNITLKNPIDGISLSFSESGETGLMQSSGFLTDKDGEQFYKFMEQMQNLFLYPWVDAGRPVSLIDNLLIVINGLDAQVYINESNLVIETIAKADFEAGQKITKNEMLGVVKLNVKDVELTGEQSVVFMFSIGWKRGVFFDFSPNGGEKIEDIDYVLASHFEAVLYSHIYQHSEDEWLELLSLGWFPFVSLLGDGDNLLHHLFGRLQEKKSVTGAEKRIINHFSENHLRIMLQRVQNNQRLQPHARIIEAGIERYIAEDYVSSINNIYPRIEGILRYMYFEMRQAQAGQYKLTNNLCEAVSDSNSSPGVFFPELFRRYLLDFYFRNFDIGTAQLMVSRHSIGHGVSDVNMYDRKHALLGILLIDQLGYYLKRIKS